MIRFVRSLAMLLLVLLGCCFFSPLCIAAAPDRPEWSIIIYIATDEHSLAANYDPRFSQILDTPLPANLELLTEQDTHEPQGTFRTIRRGSAPLERMVLPEQDSAAPENMAAFLRWADRNAHGRKRLFIVITHSWGWRGIIQDYTIPDKPGTDTMMPLREMARVMREVRFRPDVFWLDACVMGNVEPIQEFQDTAPYLIVSQREMPDNGFPADRLFGLLGTPGLAPREFVRRIPEPYIRAYSRNGSLLTKEGEFFVTTVAGIDTGKWKSFKKDFRNLVKALEKTDFPARMAENPHWVKGLADFEDHNADLVELLTRLPELVKDPRDLAIAAKIRKKIGYPEAVAAKSRELCTLDPGTVKRFELRIDADGLLPPETALKEIRRIWNEMNQDQVFPENLRYDVVKVQSPSGRDREFIVSGELSAPLRFRPWLPGAQFYVLTTEDGKGDPLRITRSRSEDFLLADRFPKTSFLISEAHTQGAPFIHGIGILLYPGMKAELNRAVDPLTKSTGRDFYRETAWSRATGWGDLMFR